MKGNPGRVVLLGNYISELEERGVRLMVFNEERRHGVGRVYKYPHRYQ